MDLTAAASFMSITSWAQTPEHRDDLPCPRVTSVAAQHRRVFDRVESIARAVQRSQEPPFRT
jgi:hypothetical protein